MQKSMSNWFLQQALEQLRQAVLKRALTRLSFLVMMVERAQVHEIQRETQGCLGKWA